MSLVLIVVTLITLLTLGALLGQWVGWLVRSTKLPPGPVPLPLLGNLLHLVTSPFSHRYLAQLSRCYGPILFLRLGTSPTIVVSSPSLARNVFQSHDKSFAGRPPSEVSRRLFYGGDKAAFTSPYGPDWRFTRKLYALHVLNTRRIQELHFPVVVDEVRRLVRRLYSTKVSGGPVIVNLTDNFSSLMESITCRVIFRERASDVNIIANVVTRGIGRKLELNLAHLVREGACLFGARLVTDFVPFLGFLDYSTKQAMDRWFSCFDAVMDAILSKREAEAEINMVGRLPDSGKETPPRDILDVLLACQEPPLSRDKIKAMMTELIGAGIDTTFTTLDWAMAEILANPRVLEKIREEVDHVVGKERMVEMADLPDLRYTKATVKETLRKHPALPLLLPHVSIEACELQVPCESDGKKNHPSLYHIPSGTRMLVNAWAIGNDPATWEDPDKFLPERFMAGSKVDVDVRGQHFELLPFGSGRRMCPGMGLALGVLELSVASLAHCFEWELRDGVVDMGEMFGMINPRKSPLHAVPSFRLPDHVACM